VQTEEELSRFNAERSQSFEKLHARQAREIEQFDLESLSLGLATANQPEVIGEDDLDAAAQGTMLSRAASTLPHPSPSKSGGGALSFRPKSSAV